MRAFRSDGQMAVDRSDDAGHALDAADVRSGPVGDFVDFVFARQVRLYDSDDVRVPVAVGRVEMDDVRVHAFIICAIF